MLNFAVQPGCFLRFWFMRFTGTGPGIPRHVKSETSVAWEVRPGLSVPTTWVRILEVPFDILSPFTPVGKLNIWNEQLDSGDPSIGGGRDLA